jgi:hypothetical protein
VKTSFTEQFFAEREGFAFAHTCERCVYHDPERDRCAHGYPDAMHRDAAFTREGARDGMFCKEFELL